MELVEELVSLADKAENVAQLAPTILIIAAVVVVVIVAVGALMTSQPASKSKF